MKSIIRKYIPYTLRHFIWSIIPKIEVLNTYILKQEEPIRELSAINSKFEMKTVSEKDWDALKVAHDIRGPKAFKHKIPQRLKNPEWIGLAIFDKTNGNIAYIAWVITKSIKYFEEFGIKMKPTQFLLKDGYCIPEYRHQGLHTRMEQERINYCIRNGANEIFIQIHNKNMKGKDSVINNGYTLYQQNKILIIPGLNVYRELHSAIRNPFKRIIK